MRRLVSATFVNFCTFQKADVSLSAGMKCAVNLLQIFAIDMCVNLRGGDIGMAEHFLYNSEICTSF
jgi:hypothetical protein